MSWLDTEGELRLLIVSVGVILEINPSHFSIVTSSSLNQEVSTDSFYEPSAMLKLPQRFEAPSTAPFR